MDKLKILWLWPDLFNLHGERGSVQAMLRAAENLGIEAEVVRLEDPDDPIPFGEADIAMLLPGEIRSFGWVKPAFERQRGDLEAYLARGGHLIALGTSGLLFGESVLREDGSTVEGLGLLDLRARERAYVWGDDLHFRITATKMEIAGSQIQMADVETATPLGTTLYGRGNDGSGAEGARVGNLIWTNCLGPVFVKNPWWAEEIVKDACLARLGYGKRKPNALAEASFDSTLAFIASKPKYEEK